MKVVAIFVSFKCICGFFFVCLAEGSHLSEGKTYPFISNTYSEINLFIEWKQVLCERDGDIHPWGNTNWKEVGVEGSERNVSSHNYDLSRTVV